MKASDLTSSSVKDMVLPFREQRSPSVIVLLPWNKVRF
jgi:hypothetical protein